MWGIMYYTCVCYKITKVHSPFKITNKKHFLFIYVKITSSYFATFNTFHLIFWHCRWHWIIRMLSDFFSIKITSTRGIHSACSNLDLLKIKSMRIWPWNYNLTLNMILNNKSFASNGIILSKTPKNVVLHLVSFAFDKIFLFYFWLWNWRFDLIYDLESPN